MSENKANTKKSINTISVIGTAVQIAVAALITFVLYYLFLPPLNIFSQGFWVFLFFTVAVFGICLGAFDFKLLVGKKHRRIYKNGASVTTGEKPHLFGKTLLSKIFTIAVLVPPAVLILGTVISSTVFNARSYAEIITVSDRVFEDDMPETNQITNIALMDTDSAKMLGNRKLGALANVVSQYIVSDEYTQINYHGRPMKITDLEYAGFFKWLNNRDRGVPGYIMVDAIASTAEYYELPQGVKYVDSAFFSEDLRRKLRFEYPTKIFDNISFEADEDGNVFYIVSCKTPKVGLFGAYDIDEVILFNPVDGSSELYPVGGVPQWVDIVFDGYLACEKYDWQGRLSGGFINSIIGNKGCKQTTADFGYIMLDDDVWYFTGVTSVTQDASNIGFILSNARTGEYKFYSVIGAEEFSAMGSAQGEVQEKGYVASFPSLVNIAGQPSYIMVLKDANGLVKLHALVNVKQYSMVATGESQSDAISAYIRLLAQNGIDTSGSSVISEKEIVVADIKYLTLAGTSYVYITDAEGDVYRLEFNEGSEGIVLVQPGDKIKVSSVPSGTENLYTVSSWEK